MRRSTRQKKSRSLRNKNKKTYRRKSKNLSRRKSLKKKSKTFSRRRRKYDGMEDERNLKLLAYLSDKPVITASSLVVTKASSLVR